MALRPDRNQTRSDQLAERSGAQAEGFLREVDDALREDQVFTALQKYGKPVGALIAAGLLGLAGYLWYENHSNAKAAEQGVTLTDDYGWLKDANWQQVLRDPSLLDADIRLRHARTRTLASPLALEDAMQRPLATGAATEGQP